MPLKKRTILAITILAGVASAPESYAAPGFNSGDLLLGVRGGTASDTSSYVIDLGPFSQFLNQPNTPQPVFNTANNTGSNVQISIGADLSAMFNNVSGASSTLWNTRSDLWWSVMGVESVTKSNTLYATAPWAFPLSSVPTTPKAPGSNSAQAGPGGRIGNNAGATYGATPISSNDVQGTNTLGLRQANSNTSSWASFNGGNQNFSGSNWAYFTTGTEGNFGNGTAGSRLELYQIISTTGSPAPAANAIGYFTIDNSGVLSFTGAVPEPGSAVLLASAMGVFGCMRRRARQADSAQG